MKIIENPSPGEAFKLLTQRRVMDIKFVKDLPEESGYRYKKGDTVNDAEAIFGTAQTRYFLETGHAEPVKGKVEVATNLGKTENGDAKP